MSNNNTAATMTTTQIAQNKKLFNRFFNPTQADLYAMEASRKKDRRRAAAGLPSQDAERAAGEIVASYKCGVR